jgi:hypothetical protein
VVIKLVDACVTVNNNSNCISQQPAYLHEDYALDITVIEQKNTSKVKIYIKTFKN